MEGRHESFAVDGVTEDLLLHLLLASVVVEGVVGCGGRLREAVEVLSVSYVSSTEFHPVISESSSFRQVRSFSN